KSFTDLGAYQVSGVVVRRKDGTDLKRAATVTPSFFTVLGVKPALGRAFEEADAAPGAPRVAVITHAEWQPHYNGDAKILGRTIDLDDKPTTIVGALPAGYAFGPLDDNGLYLPLAPNPNQLERRNLHWLPVIG